VFQETALFKDFTIGETLSYFGRIHGMTRADIAQRTGFLLDFLTLPSKDRLIKELR
jgi:ABC-type Na+ transport system ATPase subunit NatA